MIKNKSIAKSEHNKNTKEIIIVFFVIATITCLIFWQFFFKGLHPYPGNFMLAWFEPWKSDNINNGTILIVHKPVADDVFRQLYPFKTLAISILKDLQMPLWNPYNGAGMPLFATMHVGFLNPLNLVFFIFSFPFAWSMLVVIQPFLAGLLLYLYCRTIGISKLGSIMGGVSFMLSGFVIVRSIYNDYNFAIIGTIVILFVIEKYFSGAQKYILLLPFLVFFIIGSTQPQIIAYCLLFITGYFFYRLKGSKIQKRAKALNFIILSLIGIGFSAIQIIPTLELYQHSNLTPESSQFIFDKFLLPPIQLISLFIPNYFGNQSTYNYWGASDYVESIVSIGLIPCFFAYFSLHRCSFSLKDIRIFFLLVFILSIILSIKSPISSFLYSLPIPILSTGIPSRIFFLTTISISILAGFGLSNVFQRNNNTKKLVYITSFLSIPFLIVSVSVLLFIIKADCNNPIIKDCRTIALRNTLLELSIFSFGFVLLAFSVIKTNSHYKIIASTIIIFLVVLIGLYNSQKFLPFSPPETLNPKNELIKQIQNISSYSRIFGMGDANIKTNFGTFFRFFNPNYYEPLYNIRYGELVTFSNTGNFSSPPPRSDVEIASGLNLKNTKKQRRDRLLNILGVRYFIFKKTEYNSDNKKNIVWQNQKWILTKNENFLPRVYLAKNFEIIQDKDKILKRLFDPSFNPSEIVILEENPTSKVDNVTLSAKGRSVSGGKQFNNETINLTQYTPNEVEINLNTNTNQFLILSDNYYPGWKAFLDGKETKIFRANYTFRSIVVPKGKHIIRFNYEPSSLKMGTLVSIISILTLFIVFIFRPKVSSNKYKR